MKILEDLSNNDTMEKVITMPDEKKEIYCDFCDELIGEYEGGAEEIESLPKLGMYTSSRGGVAICVKCVLFAYDTSVDPHHRRFLRWLDSKWEAENDE